MKKLYLIAISLLFSIALDAMDSVPSKQVIPEAAYRICNDSLGRQIWPRKDFDGTTTYFYSEGYGIDIMPKGTVTYFSSTGDAIVTKPISEIDSHELDAAATRPTVHSAKNVFISRLRSYATFFYDKNRNQIAAFYSASESHGCDAQPDLKETAQKCKLTINDQIEKASDELPGIIFAKNRAYTTSATQLTLH